MSTTTYNPVYNLSIKLEKNSAQALFVPNSDKPIPIDCL